MRPVFLSAISGTPTPEISSASIFPLISYGSSATEVTYYVAGCLPDQNTYSRIRQELWPSNSRARCLSAMAVPSGKHCAGCGVLSPVKSGPCTMAWLANYGLGPDPACCLFSGPRPRRRHTHSLMYYCLWLLSHSNGRACGLLAHKA